MNPGKSESLFDNYHLTIFEQRREREKLPDSQSGICLNGKIKGNADRADKTCTHWSVVITLNPQLDAECLDPDSSDAKDKTVHLAAQVLRLTSLLNLSRQTAAIRTFQGDALSNRRLAVEI